MKDDQKAKPVKKTKPVQKAKPGREAKPGRVEATGREATGQEAKPAREAKPVLLAKPVQKATPGQAEASGQEDGPFELEEGILNKDDLAMFRALAKARRQEEVERAFKRSIPRAFKDGHVDPKLRGADCFRDQLVIRLCLRALTENKARKPLTSVRGIGPTNYPHGSLQELISSGI